MTERPHTHWKSCIACAHCVAVCPTEALDHRQAPLAEQVPCSTHTSFSPEQATEFLRTRRSIRNYLDHQIPAHKIEELLTIGRFALSGGNGQSVVYLVIQDKQTRRAITKACVEYMEEWLLHNTSPVSTILQHSISSYRTQEQDVVLCGAPCLILTLAETQRGVRRDTAVMALLYTQLFAPTLGLATCWAGLVEYALTAQYPPLSALLNIPSNMEATAVMMLGYPSVVHQRLPNRHPLHLIWHGQ